MLLVLLPGCSGAPCAVLGQALTLDAYQNEKTCYYHETFGIMRSYRIRKREFESGIVACNAELNSLRLLRQAGCLELVWNIHHHMI
jgi:hypothetical protein